MAVGLVRTYDWYWANRESIAFNPAMDEMEGRILGRQSLLFPFC